jgi:mono/diheme cytochrome c family protein
MTNLWQKNKMYETESGLLLTAVSLGVFAHAAPPVEEGKTIFTTRCAGCHNIHKVLTGPALAGVDKRRSLDWIVNFVHSSQAVIKKGDKDAVALFKQFNNIQMPDHSDLTAAQIGNVVEFIKAEASAPVKQKSTAEQKQVNESYMPIEFKNFGFLLSFFSVFALLVGVIILAYKVDRYKKNYFGKV